MIGADRVLAALQSNSIPWLAEDNWRDRLDCGEIWISTVLQQHPNGFDTRRKTAQSSGVSYLLSRLSPAVLRSYSGHIGPKNSVRQSTQAEPPKRASACLGESFGRIAWDQNEATR